MGTDLFQADAVVFRRDERRAVAAHAFVARTDSSVFAEFAGLALSTGRSGKLVAPACRWKRSRARKQAGKKARMQELRGGCALAIPALFRRWRGGCAESMLPEHFRLSFAAENRRPAPFSVA